MKIAVIGGKLQGVEACFLAQQAGWEVTLIDKRPKVPASGLCADFHVCDVARDIVTLSKLLKRVDLVIPALEDPIALAALNGWAREKKIPLAYDAKAFWISHSKKRSQAVFDELSIPTPRSWPLCDFPVIAKPSSSSGSRGVTKISSDMGLDHFLHRVDSRASRWILQEYLEGPQLSIEVMGISGKYVTLQITELELDNDYSCKGVVAPARISERVDREIREIAITLARHINLTGVMDVELILHQGVPKVLEIDARLPSQTPTAVYSSTKVNMLEMMAEIFVDQTLASFAPKMEAGVVYEHVLAYPDGIRIVGENTMGQATYLQLIPGFFGADFGITDFDASTIPWRATIVTSGPTVQHARDRCEQVISNIRQDVTAALQTSQA
jgi:pyrrolysine biosynthesis protein PylC